MGMLRLFAAVPLSVEVVRNLRAVLPLARAQAPGIKWVDPDNTHITVKFFGDTPEERVPHLERLLAEAAAELAQFDIAVKGIGAFPSASRPRVVWAGIAQGRDELCRLAELVHAATAGAGFGGPDDGGRFSPHVTLGRVRRDVVGEVAIPPTLAAEGGREWGSVMVGSVALYSSLLRPVGPVYRQLAQAPLRP